jgi:hypothetical protein
MRYQLLILLAALGLALVLAGPAPLASGKAGSSIAMSVAGPAEVEAATPAATPACPPYRLSTLPPEIGLEVIGIDVSASTRGGVLATLYEAAVNGALQAAARDHLGVAVIAFNSASSGSLPVFFGSFAGTSGSSIVDQANANLVFCQARRAVHNLLSRPRLAKSTGTDVGGNLAQLVRYAQVAARQHRTARVFAVTDGLTEPASGGARKLIDLRRLIDSGKSPRTIYRQFRASFVIGDARGIGIDIRGLDRQANGSLSSTSRANALTDLWTWACKDAKAATYNVTEVLP